MASLALLLLFPLLWPFVAKVLWKHEITWSEMALNLVIGATVVVAGWYGGRYSQMADTEILNGQVTSKSFERVSCEHDYKCRCRQVCSGTGSTRSCSEECDTCYDHSYDVDWQLHTTVGEIEVPRIDRQGVDGPPRYSSAQVGDPVAKASSFVNYIRGAPSSLFNTSSLQNALSQHGAAVPAYPGTVYDLHYVDRVLSAGVTVPDLKTWNRELAMKLRHLGPAKQANVILVFTKSTSADYATALHAAWLGGKKNDVIVVMGTPSYPSIEWVRVISWSDNETFKVELRDALQALKTVDRGPVMALIETHVAKQFVRKPMQDFEYLLNEIEPPGWMLGLLFGLSVLASVGASLYFSQNDYRLAGTRRLGFGLRPLSRFRR